MSEYHLTWEIDLSADSHRDAAEKAQHYQRNLEASVGTFTVRDEFGVTCEIDLDED